MNHPDETVDEFNDDYTIASTFMNGDSNEGFVGNIIAIDEQSIPESKFKSICTNQSLIYIARLSQGFSSTLTLLLIIEELFKTNNGTIQLTIVI